MNKKNIELLIAHLRENEGKLEPIFDLQNYIDVDSVDGELMEKYSDRLQEFHSNPKQSYDVTGVKFSIEVIAFNLCEDPETYKDGEYYLYDSFFPNFIFGDDIPETSYEANLIIDYISSHTWALVNSMNTVSAVIKRLEKVLDGYVPETFQIAFNNEIEEWYGEHDI